MEKPDRLPDFTHDYCEFWFEEMLKGQNYDNVLFHIKIENREMFWSFNNYDWQKYSYEYQKPLMFGYKNWLISKCLKEKLCKD